MKTTTYNRGRCIFDPLSALSVHFGNKPESQEGGVSDQATEVPIDSDFTPLSLYLELEPGQLSDLEVAARSILASANTIRDLAFFADPSLDIRIELESGNDGSLNFNAFIRSIRPKDVQKRT